jgi:vacuolar protein sorting-associated protein 13A/C
MKEILYASAKKIILAISETENEVLNNIQVQWFQVDNQLSTATSPIVIYPTVLHQNKKDKDPDNPVLFGSFCKSKDKTLGVEYYQWLTVLLQELSVDLDEDFLRALIDFSQFSTSKPIEVEDPCNLERSMVFPKFLDGSDRLYFERFLLQPVQINMSFNRTLKKEVKHGETYNDPLTLGKHILAGI